MYCCEWSTVKQGPNEIRVKPIYCKQWGCEDCYPLRQRQLKAECLGGMPDKMMTLTIRHKSTDAPEERAQALVKNLRLFRRWWEKKTGEKMEFIAVFERHPSSGFPHLHLLYRGKFIKWQHIRATWYKLTKSYIVDVRRLKNTKKAARYVTKYVTKGSAAFTGCKRYWRSRGYELNRKRREKPVMDAGETLFISKTPVHTWIDLYLDQGLTVHFLGRGFTVYLDGRPPPKPP
jgi:hypothetical protein